MIIRFVIWFILGIAVGAILIIAGILYREEKRRKGE